MGVSPPTEPTDAGFLITERVQQIGSNRIVFLADIEGSEGFHVFDADTQETTLLLLKFWSPFMTLNQIP